MSKLINEPIVLPQNPDLFGQSHVPARFTWRGREYRVQVIGGEWRRLGRWWEGEGEQRYVRTITPQGLAMDLKYDAGSGSWSLHQLQD